MSICMKKNKNLESNTERPIGYEPMLDSVNYSYLYISEKMIRDKEKELGVNYPDIMEYVESETFNVTANSLKEANNRWIKFQTTLGKLFELDEEVECNGEFLYHKLKQDWDTFYFDPNDI